MTIKVKSLVLADSFRKIFEKPLIKTFRPAANNNTDKETSKFILKKYNIDILCKDVEQKLINFYNNQSFFRE